MLVSKVWPYHIGKLVCVLGYLKSQHFFSLADKIDFMRDIIAFTIVIAVIVGVAFDGVVRRKLTGKNSN